ncbi:hypothetical protein [Frigidibacter sp. ROC022]|uniref:hypothetical protein n=1 Tax=Frigidibacter sp. ROC022 TaxID=2971796 RepID=UPI00215A5936|nr:hypothetical protein [Frigidibacter sp. ROC022]MCR8723613.1 hypothetical protein [Frigidibacter sp. ROC022]
MSARSGFVELGVVTEGLRAAPIVSETYWGYVVRPPEAYLERAAVIEIVSTFAGVLMFFAAYGHWLLPGTDLSLSVIPVKLVSTLIFAAMGAALIWTGRQGMVQELHVDTKKEEIRLVQRNRHGEGRLIALFAFKEIASVVLKRSKSAFSPTRLSLRIARSGGFVDILPSDENELLPIRDRLIVDMSPRFRSDSTSRRLPKSPAAA